MGIYGDLEEYLLREFNSSTKETIEDIALDEEEKNKIIYDISGTVKASLPELRVDYSDFSNHVYFGSAYSSVGFALKRILEYPLAGELKDINDWRNTNSGYENWFYDNFPKDHGHIFLQSGSATEACVQVRDFEDKVNFGTGSFTLEAVVRPWEDMIAGDVYPVITIASSSTDLVSLRFIRESNEKFVEVTYGVAGSSLASVSASYNAYISGTHHIAALTDRSNLFIFIDGDPIVSASVIEGPASSSLDFGVKNIDIGRAYYDDTDVAYYYSGAIDEVRIWGSSRPHSLVKKNFKRTTYANHSSSLKLYYKFNEPYLTASNRIIDYSGNDLEGSFSGSYTITTNYVSGNIETFLKDSGDIILDFTNQRVSASINTQRESGSLYDAQNSNYIFELVPSFMVDEENTEDQQKFLLLIARHWDRLKLYIEHLSNIYNTSIANKNDTPNDYLNFVAKNYGLDIGDVYESTNLLQYYYGEDILSTGSLDNPIKDVRDRIKRNIVNNLIYLYKTKSTKEAIRAALRTLGFDSETVNVNQYSIFSGGLETTREGLDVERRTLRFDGSEDQYLTLHTSSYNDMADRSYQFRFNLVSGAYTGSSAPLTSSLWRLEDGGGSGSIVMKAEVWRENISSSLGKLAVYHSASTVSPLSSSLFSAYDNKWINVLIFREDPTATGSFGYHVSGIERDEISFHFSGSGTMAGVHNPSPGAATYSRFGTVAGQPLYSNLQEVRVWNKILTSSAILESHTKDFESLELEDFFEEIGNGTLISHLRLDDATGSFSTDGIHDYVDGKSGSNFTGFSSSAQYNFPGTYIRKLQPSYQYDFNIDNDKIRIKESNVFGPGDITEDVQAVSVDFSPVSSLNKEVIKWFGGIEKFSNIIGYPYLKYRDEVTELNSYRNKFFSERVSKGIDFEAYLDIIKWFDSNFTYFLNQLIPLEINPSLSNFVVEPHILEYNKVKHVFPYADEKSSRMITGTVSILNPLTASTPISVPTFDPGRFGAFGSASGYVHVDFNFSASYNSSSSDSVNYKNRPYRKILRDYLSGTDGSGLQSQYGNGYYTTQISCSNYERDVLNLNTQFYVSGTHSGTPGGDGVSSAYFSSAIAPILVFTGTVHNAVQDSRWQWYDIDLGIIQPRYDFGIGYGGAAGQLWEFVNKSKVGETWMFSISGTSAAPQIGKFTTWKKAEPVYWVKTSGQLKDRESVILWPDKESFNGTKVIAFNAQAYKTGSLESGQLAASFGPIINIEEFTNLNVSVVGNTSAVVNRVLNIFFKFQFFDEEIGEAGFESILSSSASPNGYITENVAHEYALTVPFNIPNGTKASESFTVGFERELPRSKNMRVYVTAIPGETSSNNAVYTLIVKGTLSKGKKSKDILLLRGL